MRLYLPLVVAGLLALTGCPRSGPRVVLYCSQDQHFAEGLLGDFTTSAGVKVASKFDTEANKSVGLYQSLVAEKDRPRCDVFWNNEIVSTIRLQRQGLLEPYESPAAAPYPGWAKAADHTWHAFAGRARVLIVNTRLVREKARPPSLFDLTQRRWKGKVVMAKPQFGTTATHAACLFEVLGSEKAKGFFRDLKTNGVQLAPGNKQVAEWVGQGKTPRGEEVAIGLTDTDDALDEVRSEHPVAIVFPDRDGGSIPRWGTLFIPNSVMIVKGGPNPSAARKLVDYLLSAEVEKRLAEGPSGQLPLNPEVKADVPAALAGARTARAMAVDFGRAADLWDEAQNFLKGWKN